jgi:hypothetical protein
MFKNKMIETFLLFFYLNFIMLVSYILYYPIHGFGGWDRVFGFTIQGWV